VHGKSAQEGAAEAAKIKINCLQREARRATPGRCTLSLGFAMAVKCNQHKLYASERQEGCTQLTRKHIFQQGKAVKMEEKAGRAAFPFWQPPQNIKKLAKQLHLPDDVALAEGFSFRKGVAFPQEGKGGGCQRGRLSSKAAPSSALHVLRDAGPRCQVRCWQIYYPN